MKIVRTELAFQKEYERLRTIYGENNVHFRSFQDTKRLTTSGGDNVDLDPRDPEDRGRYREGSRNSIIRDTIINTIIDKWPVARPPYGWLMGEDDNDLMEMLYTAVDRNHLVHKDEAESIKDELRDLLPNIARGLLNKLSNAQVAVGSNQEEAWFYLGFVMGQRRAKSKPKNGRKPKVTSNGDRSI